MIKKGFSVFMLVFLYLYTLSAEPASFVVPITGEFFSEDESAVLYVNTESGDNLLVFYLPDKMSSLSVRIEDGPGSIIWEGEADNYNGVYFPESEFSKIIISPANGFGRWACALINKTEYEAAGYGFTDGGE